MLVHVLSNVQPNTQPDRAVKQKFAPLSTRDCVILHLTESRSTPRVGRIAAAPVRTFGNPSGVCQQAI